MQLIDVPEQLNNSHEKDKDIRAEVEAILGRNSSSPKLPITNLGYKIPFRKAGDPKTPEITTSGRRTNQRTPSEY